MPAPGILSALGNVAILTKTDPVTGADLVLEYVECVDDPISPKGHMENDHSEVARTILVLWDDVVKACRMFLGYPVLSGGAPGYIARMPPEYHPDWRDPIADKPYLYATDFEYEGLGVPADNDQRSVVDSSVYNLAKCTIRYNTRSYDVRADNDPVVVNQGFGFTDESLLTRYVTIKPVPGGEHLSLPQGSFKFVDYPATPGNPAAVPGSPGKVEPSDLLHITWHEVPKEAIGKRVLNPNKFIDYPQDDAVGRVNRTWFAGQPPGTLLCEAPVLEPFSSPLGRRLFNIQYNFKSLLRGSTFAVLGPPFLVSNVGHNVIFDTRPLATPSYVYREISKDGIAYGYPAPDGTHIYNDYEFAWLFRPAI